MLQLEIHTMHFDHIHLSSTPPRDNSYPAMQFCILFHCFFFYYYCYCYCYYTKQSQLVLPIYSWKCALLLEHLWLSSGCCLKKMVSPSIHQFTIAPLLWFGHCAYLSSPCWNLVRLQFEQVLFMILKTAVSLCVWKTLFSNSYSWYLVLNLFLPRIL